MLQPAQDFDYISQYFDRFDRFDRFDADLGHSDSIINEDNAIDN